MEKICIFCGNKPQDKTNEHVIPQWLIELTGNPSRKANFALNKQFAFSSFKFPACNICNNKFSGMEGAVKHIIINLLNGQPIKALDLNLLLDWLDKVRIGIWLGNLYLDKNPTNIDPNYHINTRVGQRDRMLVIYKYHPMFINKGIQFSGTNLPSFHIMPTAFTLRINNIVLMNVSVTKFLSHKLGFPYIKEQKIKDAKTTSGILEKGLERVKKPIVSFPLISGGIEIYQPMFGREIEFMDDADYSLLYDTDYVKENSLDYGKGAGCFFINKKDTDTFNIYKDKEDLINLNCNTIQPIHDYEKFMKHILVIQNHFLEQNISNLYNLPKDRRNALKEGLKSCILINKKAIKSKVDWKTNMISL
ncbi:hypothetical protein [Priestia sp. YIM B13490]|uniref:hypothetical protein n=1 Tax=Priestia sp. YIM B13490 TaxID=3366310 RepID=UPI003671386F